MPTAAHIVEKHIRERPFLHEALRRGILNNAALAEQLLPMVEQELNKTITFSAVNMAIRRLGEKLEKNHVEHTLFDSEADITTRSHLVEIVIYKMGEIEPYVEQLYTIVDLKQGDFLTITQGLHEFMIITNEKHVAKIQKLFPKNMVRKIIRNLTSVTVHIPATSIETPGMFYVVTRAMAWENINIVDIVSTYTELTFIINDTNTGKAISVLKELIEKTPNLPD